MAWEKVKLGDIATFSNGINFGKDAYSSGVKLITVSDFGNLYYPDYASLNEVDEKVLRKNDYLKDGDIVFVRSNGNKELVGRCMLISNPPAPVTYSGFCIRARLNDTQLNDPHFFAYYFKSQIFRKAMSNSAVGANIQNLNQGLLSNHILSLPPLKEQKRIADILSAYDDLIENNQKQIKLLEEAAQRLYKQWFIDLRYPGHETIPIVNGLPKGWRRDCVGNLIKKIERTKQIEAKDYLLEGKIPVIDQSRNFIAGYTDDLDSVVKESCPVIVFGDHTRILKYIQFPFAKGADGTQLIVSNIACMPQSLFYCSLVNVDLSNYHYARHFKYLKAEEIVVPDEQIAKKFDGIVSLLFNKIQTCRNQILFAQNSRDRLLPKIMNGELEV